MGNAESFPEGSIGAVGSLKHRLQSLEETIQSIEVRSQPTVSCDTQDIDIDKNTCCCCTCSRRRRCIPLVYRFFVVGFPAGKISSS